MQGILAVRNTSIGLTLSGRSLHRYLEIAQPYPQWAAQAAKLGYLPNIDYTEEELDHRLTVEMARELCLLHGGESACICRQYLTQVKRAWNTPDRLLQQAAGAYRQAYQELAKEKQQLEKELATLRPKADYFDQLVKRNLLTSLRETARQLQIREKQFIRYLLEHRYLYRDQKGKLRPYANRESLFTLKECINEKNGWSGTQTLVTPKGRETFRLLLPKTA